MHSGQRRALATMIPFSIEKLSLGKLAMSHSRTWRGGEGKGRVGGAERGEGSAGTSGEKLHAFPGGAVHTLTVSPRMAVREDTKVWWCALHVGVYTP